jgi:hypothetical protein
MIAQANTTQVWNRSDRRLVRYNPDRHLYFCIHYANNLPENLASIVVQLTTTISTCI